MLKKSQIPSHQKSPETTEIKVFANIDILIAISDFIDDKDLFNFILVNISHSNFLFKQINKTTYKTLSRSRLIEVRLLKYQLKNAKSVLQVEFVITFDGILQINFRNLSLSSKKTQSFSKRRSRKRNFKNLSVSFHIPLFR